MLKRLIITAPRFLINSRFNSGCFVEQDIQNGKYTGVSIIKLNRPDKLNALTEDVGITFEKEVTQLLSQEDLKSVIITGEGKAFSAGGDIDFLLDRRNFPVSENVETMLAFYSRFLSIRKLTVPTIAAINGPAVGAGMCLALACDIRVASAQAKMSVNFVKLGIHPGLAATYFLPQVAGLQAASYLLLTGDTIDGNRAKELGVVLETCEPHHVLERALTIARTIAECSPIAVRAVTSTLRDQHAIPLQKAIEIEALAQSQTYNEPDLLEGISAIREKRKPAFSKKE